MNYVFVGFQTDKPVAEETLRLLIAGVLTAADAAHLPLYEFRVTQGEVPKP